MRHNRRHGSMCKRIVPELDNLYYGGIIVHDRKNILFEGRWIRRGLRHSEELWVVSKCNQPVFQIESRTVLVIKATQPEQRYITVCFEGQIPESLRLIEFGFIGVERVLQLIVEGPVER